ncbi:MAG: ATP-dependent zinc metalloprotease FtsH [Anaerolineae bacterium]|nr:ATP-dependent zinc metalloprotease FtsH [Anaerolineae bacterium]
MIVVFIGGQILFNQFRGAGSEISMAEVARYVNEGQVEKITVSSNDMVTVQLLDGNVLASRKEPDISLLETLKLYGISEEQFRQLDIRQESASWQGLLPMLFNLLTIGLIAWFVLFMMRSMRSGQDQAMSFGRSRARMINVDTPVVTFADVAGVEESKQELQEIVEFLREPEKFIRLGARVPKGVLMIGPPGTGKTLLARAVAGEAGVPFMSISGSEFVEMFVGVGASRVRDLFTKAKQVAPCIVFIDEIDAVGRMRGTGLGGGHDEREQTLNQILVEMDGFDNDTNIIVIAATNRSDVLDPALLRPGRFDRKVYITRPDVRGRQQILEVHTRGKPLLSEVNLETIAKITPGFAGADLENLVNEAAIFAARRGRNALNMQDFQDAMEKIAMGPERRSRVITPEEKEVVAFHEAGHAVTMFFLQNADPVHKITIIPRGMAGGYVMPLPESADTSLHSREHLEDRIVGLLGGRAAEEIMFGRITTGASSDLESSTSIARAMVTRYGMSEKVGLRVFSDDPNMVFLGRSLGEQRDYSDETAHTIDKEVDRILKNSYDRARSILTEHRDKLIALANMLLEVETLDRNQFEELMAV